MSQDRFCFLTLHLCFDDYQSRPERWEFDRFAVFRQFFELLNKECSKHITPSEYLSLDETLYPMRNQAAFRQYNPDKPAKYGVLFKSLNDAQHSYTYQSLVYAGKPKKQPAPFYVSGTQNVHLGACNVPGEEHVTSWKEHIDG